MFSKTKVETRVQCKVTRHNDHSVPYNRTTNTSVFCHVLMIHHIWIVLNSEYFPEVLFSKIIGHYAIYIWENPLIFSPCKLLLSPRFTTWMKALYYSLAISHGLHILLWSFFFCLSKNDAATLDGFEAQSSSWWARTKPTEISVFAQRQKAGGVHLCVCLCVHMPGADSQVEHSCKQSLQNVTYKMYYKYEIVLVLMQSFLSNK